MGNFLKTLLLSSRIIALGLAATMLVTPAMGFALSNEQKSIYRKNILRFDIAQSQQCGQAGGDTVSATGNNGQDIFNFFTQEVGLTPKQAAGIMGNLAEESGYNPRALEPGTTGDYPIAGRGYGLAQWTPSSRQQGLIDQAKKEDKKVYNLFVQLHFMHWEATKDPTYGKSIAAVKKTNTVGEAATVWHQVYEISADTEAMIQERVRAGEKALIDFGSGGGGGTAGGGTDTIACDTSTSGEVVGEFSLPVPKRFYTSNPEWFTKPHHDYPAADIPVGSGTKIFSATAGKVTDMSNSEIDGRGVHVQVEASNGVVYKYFHGTPGTVKVRVGDSVQAGQILMLSDNTGSSSGPHLHFQVEVGGVKRCPQKLLDSIGKGSPVDPKSLPTSGCTN